MNFNFSLKVLQKLFTTIINDKRQNEMFSKCHGMKNDTSLKTTKPFFHSSFKCL